MRSLCHCSQHPQLYFVAHTSLASIQGGVWAPMLKEPKEKAIPRQTTTEDRSRSSATYDRERGAQGIPSMWMPKTCYKLNTFFLVTPSLNCSFWMWCLSISSLSMVASHILLFHPEMRRVSLNCTCIHAAIHQERRHQVPPAVDSTATAPVIPGSFQSLDVGCIRTSICVPCAWIIFKLLSYTVVVNVVIVHGKHRSILI